LSFCTKGDEYFKCKNYSQAEKAYLKSAQLNPKNSISYNNLGNVYSEQSKYNEATKAYMKGL